MHELHTLTRIASGRKQIGRRTSDFPGNYRLMSVNKFSAFEHIISMFAMSKDALHHYITTETTS